MVMKLFKNTFRNGKLHKDNKGFTLVEMIVVLVILAILLGVSTMGVIAWQQWAYFNKQNEYAQEMFIAAQNQLTEYDANGSLELLADSLKTDTGEMIRELDVTTLTNNQGTAYKLDEVWYESLDKEEKTKYQGTLVYASCKKGDFFDYVAGRLSDEAKATGADIVFELLQNYIYDTSILNAAISVEFTPGEGQVFAVCYSDRNNSFVYGDTSVEGQVDIRNREQSYRKGCMLGYYGADTLAKSTNANNSKPQIVSLKLNNVETLNLSFKVNRFPEALRKLTYTIDVYDKDINKSVLRVTLDGTKVRNYASRSAVACPVSRFTYDTNGVQTETALGNYNLISWIDTNKTLHIAFDAVDINASSAQYLADLKDGLGKSAGDVENSFATKSTFSFHRFGLDADNIYCTVKGSGSDYATTSTKKSNTESAFFDTTKLSNDKTKYDYTISNARHLYNVRFAEDMSWVEANQFSDKFDTGNIAMNFVVNADIDWNKFVDGGNVYNTKAGSVDTNVGIETTINSEYAGSSVKYMTKSVFPSLVQLRYGDTFIGKKGSVIITAPVIAGLSMNNDANALMKVYDDTSLFKSVDGVYEKPVGLFLYNNGSIDKINLDKVSVKGVDKVGALVGSNAGDMTNVEIMSTGMESTVQGKSNVGGVMGYIQTINDSRLHDGVATPLELNNLTNRAKITGTLYVGGIVGMVHLPRTSSYVPQVTFADCKNYGGIVAAVTNDNGVIINNADAKDTARYLGGITGFCNNEYVDASNKHDYTLLKIKDCTSSPEYSAQDLSALLDVSTENAAAALAGKLKGVYVGGIAGYNYYSTVENCNTIAEKGKTGYVFGYKYVGGIVGFNQGPASGIMGGFSAKSGVNEANVVGVSYVGGITGCNADVKNTTTRALNPIVEPDQTKKPQIKLANWINKGIIFATDEYAGGITGYNAGWIFNCDSQVGGSSNVEFFQRTYSGNYAGGIAGYNNGIIGNTIRNENNYAVSDTRSKASRVIHAICYITGKNYVGGIVGYNDVDAIIEDYEISGGYIRGDRNNSCFVGGYAGFNASIYMLVEDDKTSARIITSNPNEVTGKYFVGGNVGGNIINTYAINAGVPGGDAAPGSVINAVFKTDNFLGTLTAKEFVGGFVGYNAFINCAQSVVAGDPDADKGVTYVLQRDIIEAFKQSDSNTDVSEEARLSQKIDILEAVTDSENDLIRWNITPSESKLRISGSNDSETQNTLGIISADLYVGGVIGFSDEKSYLEVVNVKNTTPITANTAIVRNKEQNNRNTDYAGRSKEYTYSYVGGIIGRVSKNTTIDSCYNTTSGEVTTRGTYTGGLCEINAGTVRNCQASTFGSSVKEYVGSICGINEKDAVIENCVIEGKTISGKNVVAGIAAENFGTIKDTKVSGIKVLASGQEFTENTGIKKDGVAAVIAAYNAGTIEMKGTDDKPCNTIENVLITSSGDNVGIVCGINEGVIKNSTGGYITVEGNITGNKDVGGIIGKNNSSGTGTITGYLNKAMVTATRGNAGGIIGNNASSNVIADCKNYGEIMATQEGNAGGITAKNKSIIRNCVDYAVVSSKNEIGAGITAVNELGGRIENCVVRPENLENSITFASFAVSGGICGENYGTILEPSLSKVEVVNLATSTAGDIGVVTGRNMATGVITFAAGSSITDCSARTYIDDTNVGGVCGVNFGHIEGASLVDSLPSTIVNVKVEFVPNTADTANFGGVSGKNIGSIENISVVGTVTGNLGSQIAGCGGIAGYSGMPGNGMTRVDSDNNVVTRDNVIRNCTFDGIVRANGAGAGYARIGGITGINACGSTVRECVIGAVADVDDEGNRKGTEILAGNVEAQDTLDKTVSQNKSYGFNLISVTGDKASYAYIGGMVGENYGKVLSCDNYTYSTDYVKIESFAGISGGIVGITYDISEVTGSITKHLTTGNNWQSIMRSVGNEAGQGGIIGNSFSTSNMSYVDNYMDVICNYMSSTSTSGIIGRLDQNENATLTLSNIRNYGDVTGYGRAAGIIAVLKSKGATIENSVNYGSVYSYNTGSGGFVYEVNKASTDVNFIGCKNHGFIASKAKSYGYTAAVTVVDSAVVNFDDCVNTGVVTKINNNGTYNYTATDLGNFAGGGTVYYNNCRNYGTSPKLNYSFGSASSVNNCLDHSGIALQTAVMSPFANTINGANSYYVSKNATTTAKADTTGVYFSIKPYKWVYDGAVSSQTSGYYHEPSLSHRYIYETGSPAGIATIDIDITRTPDCKDMNSIVFYFGSNNSATLQTYDYTVTGIDENGDTKTFVGKTTNANNVLANGRVEFALSDIAPNASTLKTVRFEIDPQTTNNVYYYGLSWIDSDGDEHAMESISKYIAAQYGMKFTMSFSERMANNKQVNLDADEAYTYEFIKDNYLNISIKNTDKWEQVIFNVDYNNDALSNSDKGMGAFCFYPTTHDGKVTGKLGDYSYYAVFTDRDGNTGNIGTRENPIVIKNITYENDPIIIQVPDGVSNKIQTIDFYIKNNSSTTLYMHGFKWIPSGSDTPVIMPYNEINAGTTKNIALIVENDNGEYLLYPSYHYDDYESDMKNNHITMTRNNPIAESYYEDRTLYNPAYDVDVTPEANTRAGVYKELDPLFEQFIKNVLSRNTKLAAPASTSCSISNTNGRYKFGWSAVNGAYGYETYYQLVDAKTKEVRYDSSNEKIMTPAAIKYYYYDAEEITSHYDPSWGSVNVVFYVRAVNGYRITNPTADDAEAYDSDWSTLSRAMAIKLPQPKAHMEVISGNKVIAILDNAEEFELYKDVCDIKYLVDKDKSISNSVKEVSIDPAKGYSEPFELTNITANDDYTRKIYAKPLKAYESTYITSVATVYFGTIMSTAEAKNTTPHIRTEFVGLKNTTIKDLTYDVRLIAKKRDFVVGSDLVVFDEKLGVDVSVAFGTQRASNRMTDTDVYYMVEHTGFAEKVLGKDFTVRSYYDKSQGEGVWYGRTVIESIDAAQLTDNDSVKALEDTKYFTSEGERITQSICGDDGKLRPGYILIDNQDGTYRVDYNAFLELDTLHTGSNYQVHDIKYTLTDSKDANGYFNYAVVSRINNVSSTPNYIPMQVRPTIVDEYVVTTSAQGHDEFTFQWDVNDEDGNAVTASNPLYDGANYYVELIGTTVSGDEVTLGTVENLSEHSYTFVDSLDNWNYVKLKLKVVRNGVVGSDGISTVLPSITTYEFDRKLKLSTISTPSVNLKMVDGHFDKDGLVYSMAWDPITDSDQKADHGGYIVKVEVNTPANEEIVTKTHYYYVKTVEDDRVPEFVQKDDENVVFTVVDTNDCKITDTSCSMDVDLADFNGGDVIDITVKAVATKDAVNYRDSDDSEPYELTLPKRLDTPNMANMSVEDSNYIYNTDTAIDMDMLNAGVPLKLISEFTDTGKYELAIALYDSEGKALQDEDEAAKSGSVNKVSKISDMKENAEGHWNSGATEILHTKSNGAKMSGTAVDNATYSLNVTDDNKKLSDYAGQWFKIAARATSDNKISSIWSDEDEAAGNTVNYFWYQVPRIKIADPGLVESSMNRYYNPENNIWSLDIGSLEMVATNRLLTFKDVDYADGYKIQLVSGSEKTFRWIYLDKDEESFNVFYSETSSEDAAVVDENSVYTKNIGTLTKDGVVLKLPYEVTLNIAEFGDLSSREVTLDMQMYIDEEGHVNMLLPDIIGAGTVSDVLDASYNFTNNVSAQAVVKADRKLSYDSSQIDVWTRTTADKVNEDAVETIENAPVIGFDADKTNEEDTAAPAETPNNLYYFKVTSDIADEDMYLVKIHTITDTDNLVRYEGLKKDVYYTFDKMLFAEGSTSKVMVSFAKVTNGNVITKWTEEVALSVN